MFKRLFGTAAGTRAAPGPVAGLRERVESWRFQRDVAAVTATLDRLSDRQLAMIGMRRGELFEAVSDMMLRAEEERRIGREVVALLERPRAAPAPAPAAEDLAEDRATAAA
ncbi:hypothetical protein [Pseudoponticoccus marisrubri]|uniref:Uncharacterized protein n=1 Tax=Pseudoponticoccus marisrubri TaxID=1685382 RepID=A0A0W7WDY1_9RHOB|nr:hypothetical protein [Pseudoponticoccus marisrubri]KUF08738.1 hypothetical protein AVJ23_21050 [Pseudoponticoccus marisrubri]